VQSVEIHCIFLPSASPATLYALSAGPFFAKTTFFQEIFAKNRRGKSMSLKQI
jgi:hypothetical protein